MELYKKSREGMKEKYIHWLENYSKKSIQKNDIIRRMVEGPMSALLTSMFLTLQDNKKYMS